ncbi:unnamed protein product [Polarella glacialis]|uniref:Uncharacterized protein n=1 Tax=Polarella glacialis TaxID=89957 RepID=A0A813D9N1_POLGL|nr:unnamed protein product [Polarella glacialis]
MKSRGVRKAGASSGSASAISVRHPAHSARDARHHAVPWRPSGPEEAQRFEALRSKIPQLQAALQSLREAKGRLAGGVLEAQKAGTLQDRAEILEQRLALLENTKAHEVEWTIPDYSQLIESCPKGQCIVSPSFCAAGVQNMQIVFHPNGNKDARSGYSSIALRVPEGTSLSRALFINHDAFGPEVTKKACEGYTNASPVTPPSAAVRGTAADMLVVGVRQLYLHGWTADPYLQRVLIVGSAPAAEISFVLLREMRDLRAEEERRRRAAQQAEAESEQRRQEEADRARLLAEQEAAQLAQAMQSMPAPVSADEVVAHAAVRVRQEQAIRAAQPESPEEAAEREKKEKALAWLLDYQQQQADEKAEQERQRLEREQAEREAQEEAERRRRKEERQRQVHRCEQEEVDEQLLRAAEEQHRKEGDERQREFIERRTRELREARQQEEEKRRGEEEDKRRMEEDMRRQEEEDARREEERRRIQEERRRKHEEEMRKMEAEERKKEEARHREGEERRQRQEELRRMEEQRRAFEKAEEGRLQRNKKEEEEQRRREEEAEAAREAREAEEARRKAEELQQRQEEEEEARRSTLAQSRERDFDSQATRGRAMPAAGSAISAGRALRRDRGPSSGGGYGGSGASLAVSASPSPSPPPDSRVPRGPVRQHVKPVLPSMKAPDSDEEEEDEVFDMAKFKPAKTNNVPSSGSNLRAWAVAAAAPAHSDPAEDSDEELDWVSQRQKMRAAGSGPSARHPEARSMVPSASLPSMRPAAQTASRPAKPTADKADGSDDSGSDVEPVFFRR